MGKYPMIQGSPSMTPFPVSERTRLIIVHATVKVLLGFACAPP
jgi:hypothetical protein